MKYLLKITLRTLVLAVLAISIFLPLLASAPAMAAAPGLSVTGALIDLTISPGQSYIHTMTITSSSSYSMDMKVEAMGFGQTLDGTNVEIPAAQDTNPDSALQFITKIDTPSFTLAPGASQQVNVTISVPQDATPGRKYAIVYVHSLAGGSGGVGVILATDVPVLLDIPGVTDVATGAITALDVGDIASGQPITVSTTFDNTGNYQYKTSNEVTLTDASGAVIADTSSALSTSILPFYSRLFDVSLMLPDPVKGIPAGVYTVDSKIMLSDGTVLGDKQTSLTIENQYQQFPGIDDTSIVITTYDNEEPTHIDAVAKADTDITFSGVASGSGTIIIGRYKVTPNWVVSFSAPIANGGTGKTPIKYIQISISGFNQGTATITIHYTADELGKIDPSTLFLAYFNGTGWVRCDNIVVNKDVGAVSGTIPVSFLTNAVIGLGGSVASSQLWLVIIIVSTSIIVLAVIIAILLLNRRGKSIDEQSPV